MPFPLENHSDRKKKKGNRLSSSTGKEGGGHRSREQEVPGSLVPLAKGINNNRQRTETDSYRKKKKKGKGAEEKKREVSFNHKKGDEPETYFNEGGAIHFLLHPEGEKKGKRKNEGAVLLRRAVIGGNHPLPPTEKVKCKRQGRSCSSQSLSGERRKGILSLCWGGEKKREFFPIENLMGKKDCVIYPRKREVGG